MTPFEQYDKVDVYIVDDGSSGRSYMLQEYVKLNDNYLVVRLESVIFPEDLPVNRSCHITFTRNGDGLDSDKTLNTPSFFMIRTQQNVSGTMVPLPPPTASVTLSTTLSTSSIMTTTSKTTTHTITSTPGVSSPLPTNGSADSSEKSAALSPLVIGLISAGCIALLVAVLAVFLLLRARRRYKGNTSYFKNLDDQPGSPTEGSAKGSSNFKLEDDQELAARAAEYGGPHFAGSIAAGRSSSNTARSAEPMIKGAPAMLPYHSQSPPSPTAPLPLLERKTSTLYNVPEDAESAAAAATAAAAVGAGAAAVAGRQASTEKIGLRTEPVLSANDAQLIAETFRKSMRKPRWESTHDEDDEDETDEVRKAANALLRKELSEEGVDVQRGVQRRVTIQDRSIRTPGGSTLASHSLTIPPA
ncbi:hypothetical protein EC991_001201 [Linnemannia zychae]|nr:hypothetical protein EC991_001201 [Linnemannia zychae]